jgi:hypothetical protein
MRGIISLVAKQLRHGAAVILHLSVLHHSGVIQKPWFSLRGRNRTVAETCRAIDLHVCNMSNKSSEKRDAFSHLLSGS